MPSIRSKLQRLLYCYIPFKSDYRGPFIQFSKGFLWETKTAPKAYRSRRMASYREELPLHGSEDQDASKYQLCNDARPRFHPLIRLQVQMPNVLFAVSDSLMTTYHSRVAWQTLLLMSNSLPYQRYGSGAPCPQFIWIILGRNNFLHQGLREDE